jgi:hypothetical protein
VTGCRSGTLAVDPGGALARLIPSLACAPPPESHGEPELLTSGRNVTAGNVSSSPGADDSRGTVP